MQKEGLIRIERFLIEQWNQKERNSGDKDIYMLIFVIWKYALLVSTFLEFVVLVMRMR